MSDKVSIREVPTEELEQTLTNANPQVERAIRKELKRRQEEAQSQPAQLANQAWNQAFPPSSPAVPNTPASFPHAFASAAIAGQRADQNLGRSAANAGNEMLAGVLQIPNAIMSPVQTAKAMFPGILDHYNQRYLTPREGQPWYTDALNTFGSDPVGVAMDVPLFGTALRIPGFLSKMAGKAGLPGGTELGEAMYTGARAVEKFDPTNIPGGIFNAVSATAMNKLSDRGILAGPEEALAGNEYGKPKGREQIQNLEEVYLRDVGEAMDRGIEGTPAGQKKAQAAKQSAGEALQELLEQSPEQINKIDLIKRLEEVKADYQLSGLDKPAIEAIDQAIEDVLNLGDDYRTVTPALLNQLKTRFDKASDFEAVEGKGATSKQGTKAAAGVLRERIHEVEGAADALREYQTTLAVEDLATRGGAFKVGASGGGLENRVNAGAVLDIIPSLLYGQNKYQRMQNRRNWQQGRYGPALMGSFAPTPYGPLRAGAYGSNIIAEEREERRRKGILED